MGLAILNTTSRTKNSSKTTFEWATQSGKQVKSHQTNLKPRIGNMTTTISISDDTHERLKQEVPKGTSYDDWLREQFDWDEK